MNLPWKGDARPMAATAFTSAAARIGCEVAVIHAIWEVESSGREFLDDGSLIRRFEPHHFPKAHWPAIGFNPRAGRALWRESLAVKPAAREAMFLTAYRVDPVAALRAASWGGSQIMGFNYAPAGALTPRDMVQDMADSAEAQLRYTLQLMERWGLGPAMRAHDWTAIAARWNGSGQVPVYAAKMEAAYRRHAAGKPGHAPTSPVVLRSGARGAAVRRLQEALGIRVDGAFGPQTHDAVVAFQQRHNLPMDGVVGARTWAKLQQVNEAKPPAQPTVPPAGALIRHIIEALVRLFTGG
ncbi:MAG: N-acetylmuramidase domain-containing protein [Rhodobacteraceae bacterium]|jgi:hypothetical protein|nr:N-acetylmuramidase domain-containing protein [Paracoccaceae bacterium]